MKLCNGCGNCCSYGANGRLGSVDDSQVKQWALNHPEILDYVYSTADSNSIWRDKKTGKVTKQCPWLFKTDESNQYRCKIYKFRPSVCHNYPQTIMQMVRDKCEMLEPNENVAKSLEELENELERMRNKY